MAQAAPAAGELLAAPPAPLHVRPTHRMRGVALALACVGRCYWYWLASSVVLAASLVLSFLDRGLGEYGDESDNLLGGRLIAQGYRLYTDYFSQHMPLPYYVAAIGARLGLLDISRERVYFALLVSLVYAWIMVRFRASLAAPLVWVVLLALALGQPMFSGEMLLADDVYALALLVLALYLLAKPELDFAFGDRVVISFAVFAAVESTLISVYPVLVLAAYYVGRRLVAWRRSRVQPAWWSEARFAGLLLLPHVVLLGALAWDGSFVAFWDQAVRFNQTYYSHYDLGGDPLSILVWAVAGWRELLAGYLLPLHWRDVEGFLLLSNIAAILVLWRTRGFGFAGTYLSLVLLSRMRGAGYHGSSYFTLAFISTALVITWVAQEVQSAWPGWGSRFQLHQVLRTSATLAGLAYVGLAVVFLHDIAGFYRRQPRESSLSSPYAVAVAAATLPGDRVWAAPFEPSIYYLADRAPASSDWYFFPWIADSPQITQQVLADLQATRPPVIVYIADKQIPWYFPLPTPAEYGAAIYTYIQAQYVPADPNDSILKDVFLRRDEAPLLAQRLQDHGLLSAPAPS